MEPTLKDVIEIVRSGFDRVDERMSHFEHDLGQTKTLVLDLKEEVEAINVAIENDAKRYFDHDKRIARLEKAAA